MRFKQMLRAFSAASLVVAAGAASAAVVTLDFEGIANFGFVGNYYNGAPGGGTNYGASFSANAQALVDADAGGGGNFANEPSANTIMFFLGGDSAILNFAAGFDTGFSFFYSSLGPATVTVHAGLNGTGAVLTTISILGQFNGNGCVGDPNGEFCNWTAAGGSFSGIAKSISFGGAPDQTGFDNITFGSSTPGSGPGTGVPEPASLALVGAALLGVAVSRRRKI